MRPAMINGHCVFDTPASHFGLIGTTHENKQFIFKNMHNIRALHVLHVCVRVVVYDVL